MNLAYGRADFATGGFLLVPERFSQNSYTFLHLTVLGLMKLQRARLLI